METNPEVNLYDMTLRNKPIFKLNVNNVQEFE